MTVGVLMVLVFYPNPKTPVWYPSLPHEYRAPLSILKRKYKIIYEII